MSTTETAAVASATPMQYLDKAMNGLHDLGLLPAEGDRQADPIIALLNQISTLDEGRVAAIARTLSQASLFNDVVRRQVQAMEIGSRYEDITNASTASATMPRRWWIRSRTVSSTPSSA